MRPTGFRRKKEARSWAIEIAIVMAPRGGQMLTVGLYGWVVSIWGLVCLFWGGRGRLPKGRMFLGAVTGRVVGVESESAKLLPRLTRSVKTD